MESFLGFLSERGIVVYVEFNGEGCIVVVNLQIVSKEWVANLIS